MHGISVIELGGEKRTVAFNLHCMMFLSKELNCNPEEITLKIAEASEVNPLRGVTFIIYCGILGYLESEAKFIHDITLAKVSKWVGNANQDELIPIWNVFAEAVGIPKASQEQIDAYIQSQQTTDQPEKKKKR